MREIRLLFSYAIDILIPTIDTDLLILAQNRARFEMICTRALISAPEMISVCRDKNEIAIFFSRCGLKAPKTYSKDGKYEDHFPALSSQRMEVVA